MAREVIRSESVSMPDKPCAIPEKSETFVGRGGGAAKQGPDRRFQSKRTREQPRRDGAASTAPGDLSFEKKRQKLNSSVPSSRPCFSSRQTSEASNPPNRKGAKALKRVASGSNITKNVVPIGPGFQAEIPVWIAPTKKGKFYASPGDSDTLRWLGTGVWPTYSLKKKTYCKKLGQGRSDSCSCASPRSTGCLQQHIREERELLEKEIGRAFYTWKFDQMGEVGAKSWTAKEEQRFEALVRNNPMSSSKGFWGIASKAFPRKSEKDLHSYYYNVFLIKRMRLLVNNTSPDDMNSDDDQSHDFFAG
ncbi:unnamed protein product [Thlaspi arvense]|uniref:Myb-like domain-containing protein n=1 Tax=Thlaspi arvense TaxID=13288 RepID=A0AAU9RQG4_THLAR|nr:unnamed protein product [Thlaspi arvense]